MLMEMTVSAESFSLNPAAQVFATNGCNDTMKRLDLFNTLTMKTPDGQAHTITKGHIYLLDFAAYECLDDTPGGETFKIRLAPSLPPVDLDRIHDWQNQYPPMPILSEHAMKLVAYAKAYQQEYPSAVPKVCISSAIGQLIEEYGEDRSHIAQIALQELAAFLIFRPRN